MIEVKLTKEQLDTLICLVENDRNSLVEFIESDSSNNCDHLALQNEAMFLYKLLTKLEKVNKQ